MYPAVIESKKGMQVFKVGACKLLFENLSSFLYSSGINFDAGFGCGQTSKYVLLTAIKFIFLLNNLSLQFFYEIK
tara:strand:- start:309 stop:533 length:225 start_codon:yes stop_codon:yes gene_type:complete